MTTPTDDLLEEADNAVKFHAAMSIVKLARTIATLASALRTEQAAREWQPIETAPCEASILVFYEPPRHGIVRERPIVAVQQRFTPQPGMEVHRRWVGDDRSLPTPTHWMPLPDPPRAILKDTDHE